MPRPPSPSRAWRVSRQAAQRPLRRRGRPQRLRSRARWRRWPRQVFLQRGESELRNGGQDGRARGVRRGWGHEPQGWRLRDTRANEIPKVGQLLQRRCNAAAACSSRSTNTTLLHYYTTTLLHVGLGAWPRSAQGPQGHPHSRRPVRNDSTAIPTTYHPVAGLWSLRLLCAGATHEPGAQRAVLRLGIKGSVIVHARVA